MSDMLTTILFGTFTPPEATKVRTNLCMKGVSAASEHEESAAFLDAQLSVLRFLRDFSGKWYSPAEIHMNIKTRSYINSTEQKNDHNSGR